MKPPEADRFEREYGCTEAEWRAWMPAATQGWRRHADGDRGLRVDLGEGALHLRWEPLPPRVIALLRLPRLRVVFRFEQVPPALRAQFMRAFDLHLQRGGG